ncbi:hypothetical protein LMG1866_00556 [Achromobacter ruhlandii]|uniref:hypothetical protein n=1 Tax=Achromobacter ruhlandii TaxID=72557 RepID=UPI001468D8A5|nr:hypothetical protein [Achromobacter ruhlandii]CAB3661147.1 hypothetical protein LMG1866_00556 [Achromobacter ruhlandii]
MGFLDSLFRRKPTQDQFAALFIAAVRQRGFTGDLDYKADEFRLVHGEGSYFNLHNAYQAYCDAPGGQRQGALQGYVSTLLTSSQTRPASLAEARPLLRPVIRGRAILEAVRMHHLRSDGNDDDFHPALRPFGDDCVVLLALDHPESIATLTNGPDEEWGVSFDEALAIAIDNLRESVDHFVEVAPGVYGGGWEDGYDISRALLPDMLERIPARGRPIFMMPTRDLLLVSGDSDEDGLLKMMELCLQVVEHGRPVSACMYRYGEAGVERYQPRGEPLMRLQAHLARVLAQGDYDAQKEALDRLYEERGIDVFVATYNLFTQNDDVAASFSLATWTRGVDTSLPKVDRLALVRPEAADDLGEVRVVSWEQAAAELVPLLEPEDRYPVRYRTRGFPDDAQLARLRAVD